MSWRKCVTYVMAPHPGGKRLATAYSLVQSCTSLGISVRDYLIDVIDKLAGGWPMKRICELVPERWARERGLIASPDQAGEQPC